MAGPDGHSLSSGGGRPVRVFVAIPLPDEVLGALGDVQRRFSRGIPDRSVRWVRPEGIHLTLKFLGDTPVDRLPAVEAALGAVTTNAPAFTFAVGGAGCFPNPRRPRVVWVGIDEPKGRLMRLQGAIEEALDSIGFPPEGRAYQPHLTLGRITQSTSRGEAARVGEIVVGAAVAVLGQARAAQVNLIRSILKPTGAEYGTLAQFSLRDL